MQSDSYLWLRIGRVRHSRMPPAIHHRWYWKPLRWLCKPVRPFWTVYDFLTRPIKPDEFLRSETSRTGIPYQRTDIPNWLGVILRSNYVYASGPCHVVQVTLYRLELPPTTASVTQTHPPELTNNSYEFIVLDILGYDRKPVDIQVDCDPAGGVSAKRTTIFNTPPKQLIRQLTAKVQPLCDPLENALVVETLRYVPAGPTTRTVLDIPLPSPTLVDLALLTHLVLGRFSQDTALQKRLWYARTVFDCARALWPAGTYEEAPGTESRRPAAESIVGMHGLVSGQSSGLTDLQKTAIVAEYNEQRAKLQWTARVIDLQKEAEQTAAEIATLENLLAIRKAAYIAPLEVKLASMAARSARLDDSISRALEGLVI